MSYQINFAKTSQANDDDAVDRPLCGDSSIQQWNLQVRQKQ